MDLDKAIKTRKSVRRYLDKKPDWRKIIQAIDLARFAPTAGNMFRTEFILVSDKKKILEIKNACQQDFVGEAHYLVVVVSDDTLLTKMYGERAEKFGRQQAGAAIENFILKLSALGLATCWVGYYEENQIKRTLNIPDHIIVEAVFPIGFETKVKARESKKTALETVLFFDKYKNKYMEPKSRVSVEAA